MDHAANFFADEDVPRARVALLLKHFSKLSDGREPWRIEMLLLLTCATIASCDDFDDIVAWGEDHLDLLRRFAPFHSGIRCERWLRILVNRVDPLTFGICFEDWMIHALWPGRHELIAIDGKTSRRTHHKRKSLKALHTLSAYAINARLTLAQLSVPEKANEITAIPDLLDHLAESGQFEGALGTIDAMG
jgi:DDE_Tnp_1-associated